jgi:hypothetical protein
MARTDSRKAQQRRRLQKRRREGRLRLRALRQEATGPMSEHGQATAGGPAQGT